MEKTANIATQHSDNLRQLNDKLHSIRQLYREKLTNDVEEGKSKEAQALSDVMLEQRRALAPQKDILFPAQMPPPGHLLNRYRFGAPLPPRRPASLYFNRPGRPDRLPTYLEADSDHQLFAPQYYPATPSKVEMRQLRDRFERARSIIPNMRYIRQKQQQLFNKFYFIFFFYISVFHFLFQYNLNIP